MATANYEDGGERAQHIPSRAWIPLISNLAGVVDGHEPDLSPGTDSLDDLFRKEMKVNAASHAKTARSAVAQEKCRLRRIRMKDKPCKGTVRAKKDGRLHITVHEAAHTRYIGKAISALALDVHPNRKEITAQPKVALSLPQVPPQFNIVIMVVGSRGDIQPFLRIGKHLKNEYGHRVRVATHPTFRDFVEKDSGLEFFSVGGDPSELMAFMVKNPGIVPTFHTMKSGEIGKRRAAMAEMFDGFWRSCIHATEYESTNLKANDMDGRAVFIADAIIANPPSFAHVHCAEALGIPLHLVFTFPYTPTQAFPHPLASIKPSNVEQGHTNFLSYLLVEMMTWQGLGDLINDFRVNTLALDPVSTLWALCATYRMHVPVTYLWSPALIPKPGDWGEEIDVSGFVFLDLASTFEPPKALVEFLDAGEPPIYIGFGSIVVNDTDKLTEIIFEAVEKAGVRALVSRGWGEFGKEDAPDNIFMLDNTPHDWLFPRIKGCVHHGGAGTTAIGLKCGLPTMIVPFFGDQYFWGSMIGKSGAGPEPVPYKHLNSDKLAAGIKYLLTDKAKAAAGNIAISIELDGDGAKNAMETFQRHMRLYGPLTLSCSLIESNVAVWQVKGTNVRLGVLAAQILVESGRLCWTELRLLRHTEWHNFEGPGEPVTAVAESLMRSLRDIFSGIASAPYRLGKTAKRGVGHKMRQKKNKKINEIDQSNDSRQMEQASQSTSTESSKNKARKRSLTSVPSVEQYAEDISKSLGRTALAIARAPALLAVALAEGFHNAPRLYGDDTVRRPIRVSGIHSGLIASGRGFVYGLYDGVTGVISLPIRGAMNNGAVGFLKGTGMGISGLVLKSIAGILGTIGYSMQGVMKQAHRRRSPQKFIRSSRMAQGKREVANLDAIQAESVKEQVLAGWQVMQQLSQAVADEEDRRGISGQLNKARLDTALLYINVERASTCLNLLEAGKSLEEVMNLYKDRSLHGQDPTYMK